jgi:hypothetical protein
MPIKPKTPLPAPPQLWRGVLVAFAIEVAAFAVIVIVARGC